MKFSKLTASAILTLLTSFPIQVTAHTVPQKSDVRLAAASAQRSTVVSGNEAPTLSAPKTVTITEGVLTSIDAIGMDIDPGDSLTFSVSGLPPGLKAIVCVGADGKKVASAFGIVESVAQPFTLTWTVTDGRHTPVSDQTTVSVSSADTSGMADRVNTLVRARYRHGMSRSQASELGVAALPMLARMLRDENEKPHWPEIAVAIGAIGDTAYFDTLYSFVWNRFSGEVDNDTFFACEIVQGNLGTMANLSPRMVNYLLASVDPAAWATLPWHSQHYQGERLRVQMSEHAIGSLSHLNDASATAALVQLDASPYSPEQGHAVLSALRTNAIVRRVGLLGHWRLSERGEE
jgi:hypothetical protein